MAWNQLKVCLSGDLEFNYSPRILNNIELQRIRMIFWHRRCNFVLSMDSENKLKVSISVSIDSSFINRFGGDKFVSSMNSNNKLKVSINRPSINRLQWTIDVLNKGCSVLNVPCRTDSELRGRRSARLL